MKICSVSLEVGYPITVENKELLMTTVRTAVENCENCVELDIGPVEKADDETLTELLAFCMQSKQEHGKGLRIINPSPAISEMVEALNEI